MISVTIYRRELVALKACQDGMRLFEWLREEQGRRHSVLIRNWGPLHHVWLAVGSPNFAAWLRAKNLIPISDLRSANLSSADLSSADLSSADLRSADLRWANLSSANLRWADLRWADLSSAPYATNLDQAYYPTGDVPAGWVRGASGYLSRAT